MSEAKQLQLAPEFGLRPQHNRVLNFVGQFRSNPLGAFGAIIVILLVLIGLFGPLLAPHRINEFAGRPSTGPSAQFWFGTDKFGQDIFSRVISGTRISLQVGVGSVSIAIITGLVIGAASGYLGGWVDTLIQRMVDTAIALPILIWLLIIVRVLGPSMQNVIIVVALGTIPGVTRIIRGAALAQKNNQYIEAVRSVGASEWRIIYRHIIPNIIPLAIVLATTSLGGAILAESALSFLGLGIPPPNPSWGNDINVARQSFPINVSAALFPGLAIAVTVLGFNFLGDTLRDILDPRLRGSR